MAYQQQLSWLLDFAAWYHDNTENIDDVDRDEDVEDMT